MPTFMISMNYTDQGIRNIKDAPKRTQASRDLAKKMGLEVKQIYLTTGDSDLVAIVEAPLGDDIAKLGRGEFYFSTEGLPRPVKIHTPLCLSWHPATPLTEDEVLAKARR